MAEQNSPISGLPKATEIKTADETVIVQDGITKRVSAFLLASGIDLANVDYVGKGLRLIDFTNWNIIDQGNFIVANFDEKVLYDENVEVISWSQEEVNITTDSFKINGVDITTVGDAFLKGGSSFGSDSFLGLSDNFFLNLGTNGQNVLRIKAGDSYPIWADLATGIIQLQAGDGIRLISDNGTALLHGGAGMSITAGTYGLGIGSDEDIRISAAGNVISYNKVKYGYDFSATIGSDNRNLADVGYVNQRFNDLLNGAGAAYDTLKELQDLLIADESAIASLTTLIGTKVASVSGTTNRVTIGGTATNPTVDISSTFENLLGKLAGANPWSGVNTFSNTVNLSALTASQILELDASKNIISTAKGAAYNKAFGTTAGTVAEGNDSRITGALQSTSFTDTAVTGKLITNFVSAAGTVGPLDTILQAFQKLDGNDALKAPLASPTFTGTVIVPTASAGGAAVNKTQMDTAISGFSSLTNQQTFTLKRTLLNSI